MLAKALSVALIGVDAVMVEAEVDVSAGLPAFSIVGLPDQAVSEAKERVRAALRNSGLPFPSGRITVNLAPADLRKEGPLYDLPIALGLLVAQGVLSPEALEECLLAGELALDGSLRPIAGAVNLAVLAESKDLEVLVPAANAPEAALVGTAYGAQTLREAVAHLSGQSRLSPASQAHNNDIHTSTAALDLLDLKGQSSGKEALEIALAGGHNLLMIGSPGSGKTMLARRAAALLPALTRTEALAVARIHSAAGLLTRGTLDLRPPFRHPHHTVSDVSLIGGGSIPKPGEVSLAHHGLLFLDELPEFSRKALESLRQPLEDGIATISRTRARVEYPARFQLIAAMNPCPCGYWGDKERSCTCTPHQRERYAAKISGPLLDRIDLVVTVPRLSVAEMTEAPKGDSSAVVAARIFKARAKMLERQGCKNSELSGKALQEYTRLEGAALTFAQTAAQKGQLTARGYDRLLRAARSVADLQDATQIEIHHLAKAFAFKTNETI